MGFDDQHNYIHNGDLCFIILFHYHKGFSSSNDQIDLTLTSDFYAPGIQGV
jgi:hypothetical protein